MRISLAERSANRVGDDDDRDEVDDGVDDDDEGVDDNGKRLEGERLRIGGARQLGVVVGKRDRNVHEAKKYYLIVTSRRRARSVDR